MDRYLRSFNTVLLPSLLDHQNNLLDLFDRRNHSRDFCSVREELFRARLGMVSAMFALLSLAWIGVDAALLPKGHFWLVAPLMLILSAAMGALHFATRKPGNWTRISLMFNLFFALILAFFLLSKLLLPAASVAESMIIGYYFAPFILVTVLALFPMTLLEAAGHQGAIFVLYLGSELFSQGFEDITTLGEIWLLGTMALWITGGQLSQLHMLLRLYREASYDVLTGLVNRRVATKWLNREMEDSVVKGSTLSMLLFDLDHFKKINDVHGHVVGDDVLRAFGALLGSKITSPAIPARFGGEEFLAILPDTSTDAAGELAETIRLACHDLNLTGGDGKPLSVSVSIGVATLRPGESQLSFIERVDAILYDAKESGRDFVSIEKN